MGPTKILGKDRSFSHSLKFTASNPRKSMNMANERYKRHLFVPKSAVSSDVRSLLNETSYPLKFEEEGGAVVSQFEKGAMQGVASFMV